jgi:hypothetical protein
MRIAGRSGECKFQGIGFEGSFNRFATAPALRGLFEKKQIARSTAGQVFRINPLLAGREWSVHFQQAPRGAAWDAAPSNLLG